MKIAFTKHTLSVICELSVNVPVVTGRFAETTTDVGDDGTSCEDVGNQATVDPRDERYGSVERQTGLPSSTELESSEKEPFETGRSVPLTRNLPAPNLPAPPTPSFQLELSKGGGWGRGFSSRRGFM